MFRGSSSRNIHLIIFLGLRSIFVAAASHNLSIILQVRLRTNDTISTLSRVYPQLPLCTHINPFDLRKLI